VEFCSASSVLQQQQQQQQQQQHKEDNFTDAFGLFAAAANQGNADAQARVGYMLLMGLGVKRCICIRMLLECLPRRRL
jgi:TPR repeat protein